MYCRICKRELTAPKSVKLGIGPVCARRKGMQPDLFDNEEKHIVSGEFSGDIICKRIGGRPAVNIEQTFIYHSPDGFEWGYGGSGPADLALNILIRFTSRENAMSLHQAFKWDFISGMSKAGGTIKKEEIETWLSEKIKTA